MAPNAWQTDYIKGQDWSNPQQATQNVYGLRQSSGLDDAGIATAMNGAMGTNWTGQDISAHFQRYGYTDAQQSAATLASEGANRAAMPAAAPGPSGGFSGVQGGASTYTTPGGAAPSTANLGLSGAQPPMYGRRTILQGDSGAAAPSAPQATGPTSQGSGGFSQNPYLGGMADEIGRRSNLGLGQAFNQIRSNAVGVGGLGGSRQGVAEGVATGLANDSLTGNLANLYGGAWNNDQNRGLQRYQGDQSFYTQQRGQDQTGAALGADLYGRGMQGQWSPLQNAAQTYSPFTGLGTTTNNANTGGGMAGALGGALGGAQLGRNMGWWS